MSTENPLVQNRWTDKHRDGQNVLHAMQPTEWQALIQSGSMAEIKNTNCNNALMVKIPLKNF